jgi:hypothetical protein
MGRIPDTGSRLFSRKKSSAFISLFTQSFKFRGRGPLSLTLMASLFVLKISFIFSTKMHELLDGLQFTAINHNSNVKQITFWIYRVYERFHKYADFIVFFFMKNHFIYDCFSVRAISRFLS